MKKWFLSVAAIVVTALVCQAAPIDGKWKASMEGPDGKMEIVFVFKAEGNTLTGSVQSPMGELPISNGKIEGNQFSFDIDMNGMKMAHKGKIEGETITMTVGDGSGPGPGEIVLKKAN